MSNKINKSKVAIIDMFSIINYFHFCPSENIGTLLAWCNFSSFNFWLLACWPFWFSCVPGDKARGHSFSKCCFRRNNKAKSAEPLRTALCTNSNSHHPRITKTNFRSGPAPNQEFPKRPKRFLSKLGINHTCIQWKT